MKLKCTYILLACTFIATHPAKAAVQKLPDCQTLNALWMRTYYSKLKPSWTKTPLNCSKSPADYSSFEKINALTARAAYVLDKTSFTYRTQDLPRTPIVYYGRVQAPPASMLDWVAQRIGRLIYDERATSAYATRSFYGVGEVHLTPGDYNLGAPMELGIGLAAQIIHEARHLGFPDYSHIRCDNSGDYNCDATISEEFDQGGSHGVAALWLAWIYKFSSWPQSEKLKAAETVKWVLSNRINDSYAVRNAFSLRYLGSSLK
ncbi:MAG TPA: hypothetical protein VNJ01_09235 [Bacteriovoracaceae bacterium]|nr:hypothetical protein [Bacteriovoracaceae bacterium]